MTLVTCEFNFESPYRVYYGGDRIIGHCILRTTGDSLSFKGLSVKFIGFCLLNWKEKSRRNLAEPQQHNDFELPPHGYTWHNVENEFLCQIDAIDVTEMTKSYKVPFDFVVPLKTPAWLRLPCAKIYYHIQVAMQRTELKEYKFSKNVYIKQRLDLNEPQLLARIKAEYPRDNENGFLRFLIDQQAYVPGQLIKYDLKVCRLCIYHRARMSLLQHVRFKTANGTKLFVKILVENKHVPYPDERIVSDALAIPLTVPISTMSRPPPQVEINYEVRCQLMNKKNRILQLLKLPIVIGTVPLPQKLTPAPEDALSFVNFGSLHIQGFEPSPILMAENDYPTECYDDEPDDIALI